MVNLPKFKEYRMWLYEVPEDAVHPISKPTLLSLHYEFIYKLSEKLKLNFRSLLDLFNDERLFRFFFSFRWNWSVLFLFLKSGYAGYLMFQSELLVNDFKLKQDVEKLINTPKISFMNNRMASGSLLFLLLIIKDVNPDPKDIISLSLGEWSSSDVLTGGYSDWFAKISKRREFINFNLGGPEQTFFKEIIFYSLLVFFDLKGNILLDQVTERRVSKSKIKI